MAQKLTDRTEAASADNDDFLHIVDVSDPTDGLSGTSKKITKENFLAGLSSDAATLQGQAGSYYLDRTNHTGSQPISSVTGLQTALDNKQPLDGDLSAIAALAGTSGLARKTAANTWALDTNSYLTTTGNGSGLTNVNAATLDGLDSTQFLRSDQADSTSAELTVASLKIGNYTFVINGTDLEIRYNNVVQFKFSAAGELLVNDKVGEF